MSKPTLVKPIKSCAMKQSTLVRLDVHEHFSGGDLPLAFSLVGVTPRWLVIGANTGVILGETPKVAHNVQYLVSVRASNDEGEVVEHFLLKVSAESFMTSMTSAVLNLSRKSRNTVTWIIIFQRMKCCSTSMNIIKHQRNGSCFQD